MGLGRGCVDALEDDPGILGGGEWREQGDGAEEIAAQQEMVYGGPDLIDEDEGEAEDLDEGVEFAEQAGAEVAQGVGGEEQGGNEQDAEVAAEDQHGDVARDQAHVGEDKKQRAEEEFVGDGVEIETEGGALGEHAREQAVEAVAEAGQHEQGEGEVVAAVEDCDDQERDDEQTQQREQIGDGAELVEKRHAGGRPIVVHCRLQLPERFSGCCGRGIPFRLTGRTGGA